ncbi:MAG: T9SS type A sorting domain-containing protein, partial [Bacteroidales bacterium]|nr:T9SS type A sorting domain-containing protein [Bacteroidales bacterium]
LLFISNANCVSNSPVTSNTIAVSVEENPIVSWDSFEPSTLCIFWAPVALTGGMPEGGSYHGDGVIDNMFYPAIAGAGEHEITYSYATPLGCAGSASYNLFVDVCTGLAEEHALSEVTLYPNPTRNKLMVSFGKIMVTVNSFVVVNMLGEIVIKIDRLETSNIYAFDLTELKPGAYLLRIITDDRIENKTFIVRE